jgi:acryloyl-coenzyme A reductase
MRCAVVRRPGPPSVFEIEDVELQPLGPRDVRVEVARCGVSSRDLVERQGIYQRDVTYPVVMGLEIAGTVIEVGPDVPDAGVVPGTRICTKAFSSCGHCRLCRTGRESTCFARRPVRGGYGESTVLDWDAVVPIPDAIDWDQASWLGPAAGVGLNAVRDTAKVTSGETVLVLGASGAVGSASVQLARLSGARVISVTRHLAKREALLEDGASDVVVTDDDLLAAVASVRELTDGYGVDVVIDTVGSRMFQLGFDALAVHGRYAFVGELHGEEISINPARIFFKRAALLGVGSVSRAQVEDVIDITVAGHLRARIDSVLPLEQITRAHERAEDYETSGRILIAPGRQ